MSRFPLQSIRQRPRALTPKDADVADVRAAFLRYRSEILTREGARGFIRARRPDTPDGVPNSTVSEGIAYGMIIAVYMDEQPLFDDLFQYSQCFLNQQGLMDWYISPDGEMRLGVGGASDSDEDIAFALIMADRAWGGRGSLTESYLTHARQQIARLWEFEVDHNRYPHMFLPGDDWRGKNVFNPSYFAPHEYRLFGEVSGNVRGWEQVTDRGYEILERCQIGSEEEKNGLVPAWCDWDGRPVEAFPGAMMNHQYDSARTPFRIAQDYFENGDERALRYLKRISRFYVGVGADQIVDGYELDGTPAPDPNAKRPNPGSAVFVGPAAVAASHDPANQDFVDACYRRIRKGDLLARSRYYNHSWTVLSLLMLTGNFWNFPAPATD